MITKIRAKKDLYNAGRCFTKGRVYILPRPIQTLAALLQYTMTNDKGEPHVIGSWWREFEAVEQDQQEDNDNS